jgi:regulator of sigma E protease
MGGPVAIAIESYRQAKSGLRNYFYFFGAFNIMLLMLNILPLPILDGGHILFSTIESVFRKPIPAKALLHIYSIMIIILIALALLVTYNDIVRNFWRLGFP